MSTDIDIAQKAVMTRIATLADEKLGISDEHLEPSGNYKAKISLEYLDSLQDRPDGKLILVTAISPTPAGEGKTTTSVGLTDGLNRIGKKAVAKKIYGASEVVADTKVRNEVKRLQEAGYGNYPICVAKTQRCFFMGF